ncbi:hypothetical protein AKG11_10280 [Shinella sp. SUS2]|uniref:hypothetical protein n=1 Tax=unclassified Shinella TaxID=2643062 RepID=UPI0006837493|nr:MULTISPECIES: hypothetical protein [unclassified Shinella]KNY16742.1 hypothetical protein AKG11_10280 [Shinella sp. SUS2]KOC73220.1 hypothetical protein AKG10_22580 [Shinella sp. GWS1]
MIDVAIAIDGEAVNVTRARLVGGDHNDDGDWIEGAPVTATIRAAIQPVKGNQLMDMPEGIRTEAGWMCWSRSDIIVDDTITASGVSYRVLFSWPRAEGGFYRAALGRLA